MRIRGLWLAAILLFLPSSVLAEAPRSPLPDIDWEALGKAEAKKKKNKNKKKKKKKGKEEEPPPPPPDGDGDGIPDEGDGCPEAAEDRDGFEDKDGCPDTDNDEDGIADASDSCPNEAENNDGWKDEDGCPEPDPAIKPLKGDFELVNGTKVSGTVIRIVATDEDVQGSETDEPTQIGVIVNDDQEFETDWSNIKSFSAEKVKFIEAVDCYSEGVQELGEATTWECTLKNPTRLGLRTSEHKGRAYALDRKMQRLDLWIDNLVCSGDCEAIEAQRGLSVYLYRLVLFTKNDDESAAVIELQTKLRALAKTQIKRGSLAPIEE